MAAARMGLKTALFTLNLDLIAQMSCNPAVGGIAKGHLVREVDALGGIMGEVTDAVGIQFRLLNTSRGPAVWSPRAQCDKQQYRLKMRQVLESQPNLKIKQAEVADLIVDGRRSAADGNGSDACRPPAVDRRPPTRTRSGAAGWPNRWRPGRHHHHRHVSQRPDPLRRAADSRRTQRRAAFGPAGREPQEARPARLPPEDRHAPAPGWPHHRLVALSGAARRSRSHALQLPHPPRRPAEPQVPCYIAFTTEETHRVIRENVHRSPMYSGQIQVDRATLLPLDRGQDRQVSRQAHPPALSRARGPEHPRNLRQRHEPPRCPSRCRRPS